MALFQSRDRTGTNFDFNGDGSSSGFNLGAAVVSKIPTVLGFDNDAVTTTAQSMSQVRAAPATR